MPPFRSTQATHPIESDILQTQKCSSDGRWVGDTERDVVLAVALKCAGRSAVHHAQPQVDCETHYPGFNPFEAPDSHRTLMCETQNTHSTTHGQYRQATEFYFERISLFTCARHHSPRT